MAYSFRLRGLAPLCLLSVALAGCPDKKPPPATVTELFTRLVTALCKFQVACNTTPDMAACLAATPVDATELGAIEAGVAAGRISFDAAQAGTCIEWYERFFAPASCTQTARAALTDQVTAACDGFLAGAVAPGAACLLEGECVDGGVCQPADPNCTQECCAGTCAARPAPIPAGGDCSSPQTGQSCASGTVCAFSSGAGTCLVPSTVEGSACAALFACESPLFCDLDSATGTGTCRRAAATGAPCSVGGFAALACDDLRDTCDATTGTCRRRTAVGAPCADPLECIGYAQCVGGTCVALTKAGAACSPDGSPGCLGALVCSPDTNTCAASPPDGSCG
jgi:hypothetical protein